MAANYHFQVDLMAYIGAQYIQTKARPRMKDETDESYAKVPLVTGIFIPDKFNDINVRQDNSAPEFRNSSGLTAAINMNMSAMRLGSNQSGEPTPDQKTINSISTRLIQNGDTPDAYNVPSHRVRVSFSEEFRKNMRAIFAKKAIDAHPEWAGTTEENNAELRKAVNRSMPNNLGLVYLNRPRDPQPQQVAPVYTPEAYAAPSPQLGEQQGEASFDDLPF